MHLRYMCLSILYLSVSQCLSALIHQLENKTLSLVPNGADCDPLQTSILRRSENVSCTQTSLSTDLSDRALQFIKVWRFNDDRRSAGQMQSWFSGKRLDMHSGKRYLLLWELAEEIHIQDISVFERIYSHVAKKPIQNKGSFDFHIVQQGPPQIYLNFQTKKGFPLLQGKLELYGIGP